MSDAFLLRRHAGKEEGFFFLSQDNVILNNDTPFINIIVERPGDGKITAISNNTSIVVVSVNDNIITINNVNGTNGETTITVSVGEGIDYTAPLESKIITVITDFLPAIGKTLNEYTWEEISEISEAGRASSYFEVGDRKAVTVSGTVGTLSIDGGYYVYIIGFNHNGATNTIDFGTFKTALSGGTDICLIDNNYSSDNTSGTKYFNMNHWGNANHGGWKGCDTRYDVLGSTDVAPSGYGAIVSRGRTGYDATSTCATSPVSNTLMAALPSELRALMKPMTIYSDNTGGGNNMASDVTASMDYLPLLAEYEIFGSTRAANSVEQNYQAQYAYYSSGNSKVKYGHSSTGSTASWWERSTAFILNYAFGAVSTDGSTDFHAARGSYGLAPIFRV